MTYHQCPICALNLPVTMMIPVTVIHQGKKVQVLICSRCKEIKENEAKRRQNESAS